MVILFFGDIFDLGEMVEVWLIGLDWDTLGSETSGRQNP